MQKYIEHCCLQDYSIVRATFFLLLNSETNSKPIQSLFQIWLNRGEW